MKPNTIMVTLAPRTAVLLWQICTTFADMPGLPGTGRSRAFELGQQFHSIARGDIPNGQCLTGGQDALTASVMDAVPAVNVRAGEVTALQVHLNDWGGAPLPGLEVVRASNAWDVLAKFKEMELTPPAGLIAWLREAQPGDSATFNNQTARLRVYAEALGQPRPPTPTPLQQALMEL